MTKNEFYAKQYTYLIAEIDKALGYLDKGLVQEAGESLRKAITENEEQYLREVTENE